MKVPIVSVIVPCFNVEKYLYKCVNRLLEQSFQDIEILLIDDGSTDNTGGLCDELSDRSEIIRAYHKDNGGLSDARNFGLRVANGKYIYFCDPDDYVENTLLSALTYDMESINADLSICSYYMEIVDNVGKVLSSQAYSLDENLFLLNQQKIREYLVYLHDQSLVYNAWNKLYKKEIIDKFNLKYKKIPIGEDWEFNLNYLLCCNRITVNKQCLYHYIRERSGALSTSYRSNWFELRKDEHKCVVEYFRMLGILSKGKEYLYRRLAERILGCLENEFSKLNTKSDKLKFAYIDKICRDALTQKAFANMQPTSMKVRLLSLPIRMNFTCLVYVMMFFISCVRNKFPVLFFVLKGHR